MKALGSMEYACEVAGSKIVVVLGHTKCGAITSACQLDFRLIITSEFYCFTSQFIPIKNIY